MEGAFQVPEGVGSEEARFAYIRAHFPPPPSHQAPAPPSQQPSGGGKDGGKEAGADPKEAGAGSKRADRAAKRLTISQHAAVLVWLDDEQSQLMWVPKPCTVRRFCTLIDQQTFHGLANENFRLIEQRSRQGPLSFLPSFSLRCLSTPPAPFFFFLFRSLLLPLA